jgi:hypothetical protein
MSLLSSLKNFSSFLIAPELLAKESRRINGFVELNNVISWVFLSVCSLM